MKIKHQNPKKLIAKFASDLVSDNDVIYIDFGTTNIHMVPYLAHKKNLTIVTADIHVINIAASYQQKNVIATGGLVYRPFNAFVGSSVIDFLKNYNISKTFFATNGYSIENGVTNTSSFEWEIKQYLMKIARRKFSSPTLQNWA